MVRPGRGGDPGAPVTAGRSADDTDEGWHEGAGTGDSNDEQLRRDVPPHW